MTPQLPRLILITDWRLPDLLDRVERALDAGPDVAIQHREPGVPVRAFLEHARALVAICELKRRALFVNCRLDVAIALGVHLHLPAGGMTAAEARPHLLGGWISVAVHNDAEAHAATGADLALVSPVHSPGSKPGDFRRPLGAEGFRELARALPCPAYALGGMTGERIGALEPAGAAVISAVLEAKDPRQAAAD
ncbi:MAG TPA: thiamine phosphate synthase, partial [Myxococcaceae bacterium]|nr:thiamine phosphate synthase [Myxococcaceae bacterium]